MSVREVTLPSLGRTVKLGRQRPALRGREVRPMKKSPRLPTPPASCDYSQAVRGQGMKDVFGNDVLSDCVIAAMCRIKAVLTANNGKEYDCTSAEVLALYHEIGGYVQGQPQTDQGCDEQSALNAWETGGAPISGSRLLDWLALDPTEPLAYRVALWRFGSLFYGIDLPDAWLTDVKPNTVWDAAPPNPSNGHAVPGYGYSGSGVYIDTWGISPVLITDLAHQSDVVNGAGGELYMLFDPDWYDPKTGRSPAGFHWDEDVALWKEFGGKTLPAWSTPPPPPPPPPPVPPVSSVIAIVDQAFKDLQAKTRRPLVREALLMAQALVDQWLVAHGIARPL